MLNLSIRDIAWGPKTTISYSFYSFENFREEDNLSIRDKTAEFGSTVHAIIDHYPAKINKHKSCKVFN